MPSCSYIYEHDGIDLKLFFLLSFPQPNSKSGSFTVLLSSELNLTWKTLRKKRKSDSLVW